jgi:hypothetical protein
MKRNRVLLQTTVLVAGLLALANYAPAQNRRILAQAERYSGDRFTIALRTPNGASVYAAERPSPAMLGAIDRGLTDLFAVARRSGYGRRLRYSDYSVFIARPDRTKDPDGKYSPDIAVGAAQYAGTDYDKGGYIYASGMVVGFDPASFLIADHKTDMARVSNIVRYEGEHLVLYHNDRRRYSATADHSKGGGHPILK